MLTLSKRASDGLLGTRQRHQRDLFSGDLVGFQPPIIPPAPINFQKSFSIPPPPPQPPKRTHVGNVVHTFEAMAMQRSNQQQQQQQKYDIFKPKEQQQSFSKYIKNSTKRLTKLKWQTSSILKQQQHQQKISQISMPKIKPQAHTFYKITPTVVAAAGAEYSKMPILITKERKTFSECNKQIAQHYHHQMELDYRKNLFSTKPHVNILNFTTTTTTNNINNNNNNEISKTTMQKLQNNRDRDAEGEDVIVNFDEMLAGYTATDDNNNTNDDDDENDDDYDNHNYVNKKNDEHNYSTHVSVINISGNEAKDNAFRINLTATNDKQMASEQRIKLKIKQQLEQQKQLLPIIRKKAIAPAAPQPTTKISENKSLRKSHLCEKRIFIPLTTATTKAILNKRSAEVSDSAIAAASNIISTNTNDNFLRGTTLSQSFVRQFKWQKNKKPAPPPPITLDSSSSINYANNNNHNHNDNKIFTTTTTRLSLANPWRHMFRLKSKHTKSFDLLK